MGRAAPDCIYKGRVPQTSGRAWRSDYDLKDPDYFRYGRDLALLISHINPRSSLFPSVSWLVHLLRRAWHTGLLPGL